VECTVQFIMLSIYVNWTGGVYSTIDNAFNLRKLYTPSVQRSAWRCPYNWAETCSWNYNLIKCKVVYDCIMYILYLAYIQRNGDVSLEKKEYVLNQKHWWEQPRFLLWIMYCNTVLSDAVRNVLYAKSRIKRWWT